MTLQSAAKILDIIKIVGGAICVIALWAASVEISLNNNSKDILENSEDIEIIQEDAREIQKKLEENHDEVMNAFHSLELQLKDKEDRE